MTKAEIKNEIQKVLDNVPENVLQDILGLLKGLQNQPGDKLENRRQHPTADDVGDGHEQKHFAERNG